MSYKILGVEVYYILSWFIVYSFLGWVWESCYVSLKNRTWVNRGFVSGPFVTLYGVGAVSVYVILKPFQDNPFLLYIGGVIVTTILEYITGVLMETVFHANWWDYSKKKFNFQGKICLGSSIAWGFFTLLLFYVIHPPVARFVDRIPKEFGKFLICVWGIYYALDFTSATFAAMDLKNKLGRLDDMWDEFQEYYQGTKMYETGEEIRERVQMHKLEIIEDRMEFHEALRQKFQDAVERLEVADGNVKERREELMRKYDDIMHRSAEIKKSYREISKRHMKAYPNLVSKAERLRRLKGKK